MVEGVGGAFLFCHDSRRLAAWYRENLEMDIMGEDKEGGSFYKIFEFRDLDNPENKHSLAWAIHPAEQNIEGQPRTAKINYRVSDLAGMLARLKSKGVTIEKTEEDAYGSFATLQDPDGNQVELWEPNPE